MAAGLRTACLAGLIVVGCLIVVLKAKSGCFQALKWGKYEEPSLPGSACFMVEAGGHMGISSVCPKMPLRAVT